ncbi:hypothetical protein HOY80DRAFT_966052 [Tuber brumale]|nr:hypothetical protein HOY80DRAFT_966052 [Tuber brumale]
MLSTITRSPYICAQCRYRILRSVASPLLRVSLITNPRRNNSTLPAMESPEPKPKHQGVSDDYLDSLVDSFVESAFSNTSLPPRPPPGIGKTENLRRVLQALPDTWEGAGVRPVVAEALSNAYPNTIRPTDIQKRILAGLRAGNSVAVRDLPGTGKSFAIASWVLGLERAMRRESDPGRSPTTTAYIFVPTPNLGIQYYLMIKNLLRASSSQAIISSLDSFVQLLYRRAREEESQSQIKLLSEKPNPHIIIATPTIAMDIISDKSDSVNGLLDFSQTTAFVLDEIDALIPRTQPTLPKQQPRTFPHIRAPIFTPPSPPDSPAELLLDWVFKRRKNEALARKVHHIQPQLVLSSATLSTSRMIKFTLDEHPLWMGREEKSSPTTDPDLYNLPKAARFLPIGDESSGVDKIVRAVADNIVHHAVAYDISSGLMRDAPIPRTRLWTTEEITQKLRDLKVYEAENAESIQKAKALKKERDSLIRMPLESWDTPNSQAKRAGYDPGIAAEALERLLECDKWPRNAIAAVGREAGVNLFIAECAKLGIDARELTVANWNKDMEKEGRIPIGRTDMLFDPKIREYYKERNERDACRDETIVWVTTSASARGLDVPGVFHLYILHRLEKAREYTTYCGRVARWPFPTLEKDIKDPRSLGIEVRRGVGKVVSLLLEDHEVPTPDLKGSSMDHQVIVNDGSNRAGWSWLEEGLMVAKIGCHFQDYYGETGEYPCGPEVRMPMPIWPYAPSPTPSRTLNLLDAALGSDPLRKSSFSDPSRGSSSDQIPGDLSEPSPEQTKRAPENAQLEPSTDLPDLPDMWSLPFPDGSGGPEELQQPNRNPYDGDGASFRPAPKDSTPASQTPDSPFFSSPEEDFRLDRYSRHTQETEASRLPTRTEDADDGYREPPTKSQKGRGKSKAPTRVSAFSTDAAEDLNPEYISPREQFRPELKNESERKKEAEMLSLTAIDAEEGYQEPPGTLKVNMHGFDKHGRTKHPKNPDQNLECKPTFVPFREVEMGPPESEKKAKGAKEKRAPKVGEKAPKEEKKVPKEEKKAKKKKVPKVQEEIAEVDTNSGKARKPKRALKRSRGLVAEAIDDLKNALENKIVGQTQDTKFNDTMDKGV